MAELVSLLHWSSRRPTPVGRTAKGVCRYGQVLKCVTGSCVWRRECVSS